MICNSLLVERYHVVLDGAPRLGLLDASVARVARGDLELLQEDALDLCARLLRSVGTLGREDRDVPVLAWAPKNEKQSLFCHDPLTCSLHKGFHERSGVVSGEIHPCWWQAAPLFALLRVYCILDGGSDRKKTSFSPRLERYRYGLPAWTSCFTNDLGQKIKGYLVTSRFHIIVKHHHISDKHHHSEKHIKFPTIV
jgi:hypothetical protein